MNKYTFKDKNGATWERVTRPTAKKQFINGAQVLFIPCKARPDCSPWDMGYFTDIERERKNVDAEGLEDGAIFDRLEMYFNIYNCQYAETGKYTAFYTRQEAR